MANSRCACRASSSASPGIGTIEQTRSSPRSHAISVRTSMYGIPPILWTPDYGACRSASSEVIYPGWNGAADGRVAGRPPASGVCGNMIASFVTRLVDFCIRHAWWVIGFTLILGAGGAFYVDRDFAINTDVNKLLSSDLPWKTCCTICRRLSRTRYRCRARGTNARTGG